MYSLLERYNKAMSSTRTIKENIARITAGTPQEAYPVLSSYLENKRSRLKRDLLSMLEYMRDNPRRTLYGGERYWTIPKQYMMIQHGGTSKPWQSHLVFFSLTGLLERVKPNGETKNREMAAAYLKALEEGTSPEIFYSCHLYTAARMAQIEAKARRFKERGVSLSDIRKTDIIALYGPVTANLFYQDTRTISAEDEEAAQRIIAAIQEQITARGYALKAEAIQAATRGTWQREELYQKIQHQAAQFTALCQDHGLVYRRANKEECRAWGLSYGAKVIITAEI